MGPRPPEHSICFSVSKARLPATASVWRSAERSLSATEGASGWSNGTRVEPSFGSGFLTAANPPDGPNGRQQGGSKLTGTGYGSYRYAFRLALVAGAYLGMAKL